MPVADLPADEPPYFFVVGGNFVPKKYYNEYEKSPYGSYYGAILPTPHFEERWREALAANTGKFAVVVDAHN